MISNGIAKFIWKLFHIICGGGAAEWLGLWIGKWATRVRPRFETDLRATPLSPFFYFSIFLSTLLCLFYYGPRDFLLCFELSLVTHLLTLPI